ncbi:MAG: polyprenyl synthetase family protein, partial [SAR324 cluster bacterium]|nr:polyprenyl synthetase family protein [SAR324 cluster bacterium]
MNLPSQETPSQASTTLFPQALTKVNGSANSSAWVKPTRFLDSISTEMAELEGLIREYAQTEIPLLNSVSSHLLEAGGKRLRPVMVLLGGSLFRPPDERVMQAALVVEYLHTATLLHDDVVDGGETRRGHKAPRMLWGDEASVLSGDYLFSLAFHTLTRMRRPDVLELMSGTTTKMACGELQQLTRNFLDTSETVYYEIINCKTACLFGAATKMGALLSGASPEAAQSLYDYGAALGMAFQVVDDALDYGDTLQTGKPVGTDLQERKITLPLSHLLRQGSSEAQAAVQSILNEHVISDCHVTQVIGLMQDCGSIPYTLGAAQRFADEARTRL